MLAKDIIGKKYGRLTVVKLLEERGNRGQLKYLCECECGKKHITSGESIRAGKSKSCGCLKKEFIEKNKFKRIEDREIALLKVQYSHLKRRNKKMGFVDVIDFETFTRLSKGSCKYCGLEYSKEIEDRLNESKKSKRLSDHILKCNGIDRVDNKKGYVKDNCVSCCKYCNFAKHTMTEDEFYKWIKKVYEYNF
jgi:hypothetical protein